MTSEADAARQRFSRVPTLLGAIGRQIAVFLIALILSGLLWSLFLSAFSVAPVVGKTPIDVWAYLFSSPQAVGNRAEIVSALKVTIYDAGIGFVFGMVLSFAAASAFVLAPIARDVFLPFAILLRSFPVVVLTPVILLSAGRGILGLAIIGTIVVFFSGLVVIFQGLKSVSSQLVDLIRAYGGSDLFIYWKIAVPFSLPSLFLAAKLALPLSFTGALLAEWLATGNGIGSLVQQAPSQFHYSQMWAGVVAITVVSVALYAILSVIETICVKGLLTAQ